MKKIYLFLIMGIFLFSFASADSIGTYSINQEMQITNYCQSGDCTYINLISITKPSGEFINLNASMDNNAGIFNYSYTPDEIGLYGFITCGDPTSSIVCDSDTFKVTSTGEETNATQGLVLIAQLGVVALLFAMGRIFDKKKWKIKMLFDMMATLMTLVLINSLKILSSESFKLSTMGTMAFYIGMVITSFMFLYLFINATIELINYFKKKRDKKWGDNPYE